MKAVKELLAKRQGGGEKQPTLERAGSNESSDAKVAVEAVTPIQPAGLLGGLMSMLGRKKTVEAVVENQREEWEDWNLEEFLAEMKFSDAPSAAKKDGGKDTKKLPSMSAHPNDPNISFEQLMAEYQRFEQAVDKGGGLQVFADSSAPARPGTGGAARPGTAGEDALNVTGILKGAAADKQRADLLKSRGGKDQTTRVKISEGDVDRRAEVREIRTAGATTVADGLSRPSTVRWGPTDTAGTRDERPPTNMSDFARGESRGSTAGRPDTGMSNYSVVSDKGRLDVEPMGDALMFDQPGFFNCSKRELLSIPMLVYSEEDFGGPCFVLWAHHNRIQWLPEVVGRLTALTELRLHHNKLEVLPPEFARMRSIRRLWLNDNLLTKCPDEIGELTTLELLNLSNNPFTELTTGVGRLIRLQEMMLNSLQLTVPPVEIIARGPGRIVEYMGRIRAAQEACERYRAGADSTVNVVQEADQMILWRLSNDAPTQDDQNFWRQRTFGVDVKGNLCYAMSADPEVQKEWIEIGNVRQIKVAKAANKLNFPVKLVIESAKISMFVALNKSSDRDKFLKLLKAAQANVLCSLELRDLGIQKIPAEVVRLSELTALDISNNQIKRLPRMFMPLLETLILDRNGFSAVPRTIYEDLTCIARLSLRDNPIVALPTALGSMPILREIHRESMPMLSTLDMNVNFNLESPPTVVMSQNLQLKYLKVMLHSEKTGSLDLSQFALTELPNEIGKRWDEHPEFHNLHTLNLKHNRLLDIDQGVDKFINVVSLDLSQNRITRLPKHFGIMIHISELFLGHNEIRELPKSMKSMAKLVSLHVHHNEIYVWPWCLEYLTSLTELHLNHNAIEEVPAVCSSLHALRELQLSGNKIWTLPVEVNGWSSLTELKMDQNRLPQLPETLGQLERLEFVSFAENHIDAFPTEVGKWVHMKSLDLSGNQIPYLPEAICNSTALKKLLLEGNPLVQLPLAMGCMRALKKLSYTGKGEWISPPNEVMGKTYNNVIKYLQKYDDAKTTNQLDLSKEKHEYLHADILSLSNLTELDLSDNLLENLTVVIGEVDGSWTKLKGDRDLYVPEAVYQDKQNAKMAMLSFLGEGLNNRQLAQRCEKIFSQIDYDQGGTLGLEELDICFRRMGCKVSREVILMMVMEVSEDGDQEVNMNEWNKMVQSIYKGKKDCQGIGDLKNLVTLNLSRNKLTRLPYGLGFCTALQHLVIDEPHMIVIPCDDILRTCGADATILTRYLRQIHQACISNKLELNGFIINVMPTEIFELTALTELHMSGNSVKIVGAEIEALQQLKLLDLSYNRIKLLPPTLGKLRKLEEFDVQSNALQHLPAVICTMDKLSKVHVIGNKPLSVPREVQNAGTPTLKLFMKGIYTGSNDGVVNWSELNKLKVAKLKEVPNVLFSMNWISDLNLDDNAIKTLPAEMGTLKALTRLSARHNFIEKLPSEMKRCKNLEKLYIDHNRLTKLPTFVYTHLPINVLGATHNKLDSSCIPESLPVGSASRLQALTLDHNSLGKLSGAIEVFGQLKMLSLNFNALGGMPPELGSVTALTDLQFDGNEVEELPVSMQNLTNLVRLKFNDNKVVYIPDWIGKFTKLQQLSAGNNRLQFIPYPITALKLSILTLDGNPLTAVETGVLVAGPKEVVHFLDYNHNYDLPDRNLIPDPIEQRRQINAHINSYAHEAHRLQASRLESEYRNIGGFNSVEIAYNKQIGHDRTEGSGAIILDEEMLRDVQIIAERDLAGSMIYGLFGPGLTGDIVRTRAKDIFYQIDKDGGGSLDPRELQNWFASLGANLTVSAINSIMTSGKVENPEKGIKMHEFQDLVYIVYQIKS